MMETVSKRAFEGIKICDFTWAGVGPFTTKYFADHGASVVRIESLHKPDGLRTSPPFKDGISGINRAGHFAFNNPNKYSIALNMNHPRAIEVIHKMVAWADIVTENFVPGQMEKWGLDYENLKKIKPDIIMYRASNQGQTGPHAQQPGFGSHLVGLSGFASITGWPDRAPVQPYGAYTDVASFPLGASALVAALIYRNRTGKGQCVDLSQFEASVHFLAPLIMDYTVNKREAGRMGNRHSFFAPHGVYRCKGQERWCAIAVSSEKEWDAFCRCIGRPELINDARFATFQDRKENEDELDKLIEEWTMNSSPEEIMTLMQKEGVPAGVVENAQDLTRDPQLKERGHFWNIDGHSEMGSFLYLGQPYTMSKTPPEPRLPSPCLGEHTEYVCRQFLGMSDTEFLALVNTGVFE
jgi:benzylsuccinate CoA-transferase BbsF subunit